MLLQSWCRYCFIFIVSYFRLICFEFCPLFWIIVVRGTEDGDCTTGYRFYHDIFFLKAVIHNFSTSCVGPESVSIPFRSQMCRARKISTSGTRLQWGMGMWTSAAEPSVAPFHNHLSPPNNSDYIWENEVSRGRSAAASLCLCLDLSPWITRDGS